MDCPKCKKSHHVKDGIVCNKQRYKCKECRYRYTVERKSDVKPAEVRRLALELYLEGLSFRAIERILKISYGTVYAWVQEWGLQISILRRETPVKIVEFEKIHAYVESRKKDDGNEQLVSEAEPRLVSEAEPLLLIDLKRNISMLSMDSIPDKQIENR